MIFFFTVRVRPAGSVTLATNRSETLPSRPSRCRSALGSLSFTVFRALALTLKRLAFSLTTRRREALTFPVVLPESLPDTAKRFLFLIVTGTGPLAGIRRDTSAIETSVLAPNVGGDTTWSLLACEAAAATFDALTEQR